MKLEKFSAKNYRSITDAYRINLADYSVLIGPNNQGKSNFLHAMVISFGIIDEMRKFPSLVYSDITRGRVEEYSWKKDFPLKLQEKAKSKTIFQLEFALTDEEKLDFSTEFGISLNQNLKVRIEIGEASGKFTFPIASGPANKKLNQTNQFGKVAKFISDRILFQNIPTIRTANLTMSVVNDLLTNELLELESDSTYSELLNQVIKKQEPVINDIADQLTKTVQEFIPDVKKISIKNAESVKRAIRSSAKIFIDDGNETELGNKGEGMKSLIAISLLRGVQHKKLGAKNYILAIEEPEAHLHPKAVHGIMKVLQEISGNHQVIVTTHSPLLIDRKKITNNVIIQSTKAKPAKDLSQLRDCLGTQLSDNLSAANLILLVEGTKDARILKILLNESTYLKRALENNQLAIVPLGGASKLDYVSKFYKSQICNIYAFIDHDSEGTTSVNNAETSGGISADEYSFSVCPGMKESEIEDLIDQTVYEEELIKRGANLLLQSFKASGKKWSVRMKEGFSASGNPLNDENLELLKEAVCKIASEKGSKSIRKETCSVIESLIVKLESKLKLLNVSKKN